MNCDSRLASGSVFGPGDTATGDCVGGHTGGYEELDIGGVAPACEAWYCPSRLRRSGTAWMFTLELLILWLCAARRCIESMRFCASWAVGGRWFEEKVGTWLPGLDEPAEY